MKTTLAVPTLSAVLTLVFALTPNGTAAADAQSQTAICDGTDDDGFQAGVCCANSSAGIDCETFPWLAASPTGWLPVACPCIPPD